MTGAGSAEASPPRTLHLQPSERAPDALRGAVVAIGNFDGLHRGHQAVVEAARAQARERGVPCLLLTFEPHPRAYFSGRPVFRLTPPGLRQAIAAALGVDATVTLPFDARLASESAEDFVSTVLVEAFAVAAVVTGYDFHFGRGRQGTPDFLRAAGERHGFAVEVVGAKRVGDEAVSSTRIRAAIARGDVAEAGILLGWSFAVEGRVEHGEKRGRTLGYPTANMRLDPATELAHGIYAVRYRRADGTVHEGVASFGRRPTFGGGAPLLETFLFGFAGDLYGQIALVTLEAFIRPEERFESVEALVARMDVDALEARAELGRRVPGPLDLAIGQAWTSLAATSAHPPGPAD